MLIHDKKYQSLSFEEKIQFVIDHCDKRIAQLNKLSAYQLLEKQNIFIVTLKAIRDYLHAYLNKDLNGDFETILENGYKKYDEYAFGNYIPTFELCKKDALNLNDLECAFDIVNQSAFLSNDDFFKYATKRSGNYAITRYQRDNNSPNEEFFKDLLSNGFKYYLEGILWEQHKKWNNDNQRSAEKLQLGFKTLEFLIFNGGSILLLNRYALSGAAFLFAAATIHKIGDAVSDRLAVNFFSNSPKKTNPNEIHVMEKEPKQHMTPYSIGGFRLGHN